MSDTLSSSSDEDFGLLSDILGRERVEAQPELAKATPGEGLIELPTSLHHEGARNRRIIEKNAEISQQLDADHRRMEEHLRTLAAERDAVVAELNDNGAHRQFSWRLDAALVDKYIGRTQPTAAGAMTCRHFYYFDDVQTPAFAVSCAVPAWLLRPGVLRRPAQLLAQLAKRHISFHDFLMHSLNSVHDPLTLRLLVAVVQHYANAENTAPPDPLESLLAGLGAKKPAHRLHAKLLHYNNHGELLVLRLCLVFLYTVPFALDFEAIAEALFLSASDFRLNKDCPAALRHDLVGPVFLALVEHWQVHNTRDEIVYSLHKIFSSAQVVEYNGDTLLPQKGIELHFNMLWHLANVPASSYSTALNQLFFVSTLDALLLACLISKALAQMEVDLSAPGGVYKNAYRSRLLAREVGRLLYEDRTRKLEDLARVRQKLLGCKDNYQLAIAKLLHSTDDSPAQRHLTSTFLSDTYYAFHNAVQILDKNPALMFNNFFYDDES